MRFLRALCALALIAAHPAWSAERLDSPRRTDLPRAAVQEDDDVEGGGIDTVYTTDTDHFRSYRLRAGALVHYASPYDLIAVGGGGTYYKQGDWSKERYTLAGAIRKVERATGAGVVATVGVSSVDGYQKLIGEGTWNIRLSGSTGMEFIGQRDFVETRAALDAVTMTNYLATSVDHAVSDRLTVIGLGGFQWFSDDNHRTHLRGRVIYALFPEQGLSAQVRAQGYESSRAGSTTYFNPERYERADIGLRLRRSMLGWRVLAAAGGGQERIDETVKNPTAYAELRGQRSFANNLTLALTFAYFRASEAESTGSGNYNWRYYRALFIIPF